MTRREDTPIASLRYLRWVTATLGVAAFLTAIALSSHDPLGLVPAGGAKYSGTIPTPDTNQEALLRQAYRNVEPRLDDKDLVPAARALCRDILGGSTAEYLAESTRVRHMPPRSFKGLTDDQARRVITAVKTNGFCHA
jgi:hypothetical protein